MQEVTISRNGKSFRVSFDNDSFEILHADFEHKHHKETINKEVPCNCPNVLMKVGRGMRFFYVLCGRCDTKSLSRIELRLLIGNIIETCVTRENKTVDLEKFKFEMARVLAHEYGHFKTSHQSPFLGKIFRIIFDRVFGDWTTPFVSWIPIGKKREKRAREFEKFETRYGSEELLRWTSLFEVQESF